MPHTILLFAKSFLFIVPFPEGVSFSTFKEAKAGESFSLFLSHFNQSTHLTIMTLAYDHDLYSYNEWNVVKASSRTEA